MTVWEAMSNFSLTSWIFSSFFLLVTISFVVFLFMGPLRNFSVKKGDVVIGLQQTNTKVDALVAEERNARSDMNLSIQLKKFTDAVDSDMHSDITALIQHTDERLMDAFGMTTCSFPIYQLIRAVKNELYNRNNHNNLNERLSKQNREWYVEKIKEDVEKAYRVTHGLTKTTPCELNYPAWEQIGDMINGYIDWWVDSTIQIVKEHLQQKVARYKEALPQFKSELGREMYCEAPMRRNEECLAAL